jgi:SHS2 domain-containing protein
MSAPFYRELAHPADLCLQVWGATRADLYAHAAQALFETIEFAPPPEPQPASCRIELHAPDPETLLVDWLSELLYESERQRAIWQRFEVTKVSSTRLHASISGVRPSMPRREVKAVTYAGLEIRHDEAGEWSATITFDV